MILYYSSFHGYLGSEQNDDKMIWIGGYQMFSNNTHYWLDGEAVNVDGLSWVGSNPNHGTNTHLYRKSCNQWFMRFNQPS